MQGRHILHLEGIGRERSKIMIDPHVHLRDWNQQDKETMLHGLKVAKACGFTHVFDMPNTNPAITSREVAIARLADASDAKKKVKGISYHLYGGLTLDKSQIKEMVSLYNELFPLVVGLKLFAGHSTGNMGIIGKDKQLSVFKALKEFGYKGVLAVHSEKEELISNDKFIMGKWETHSLARPNEAEVESIRDLIDAALSVGFEGTLHIAHISTKASVELVKANRDKLRITMGATPHHALYSQKDAECHEKFLKMNPPLRSEEDRDYIFNSLLDGTIDWVESDHAPHTLADKESGASGIPGFTGMLVLLDALKKAGCSDEALKKLFGGNAMSAFGLEAEEVSLPNKIQYKISASREEYPIKPF